MVLEKFIVKEKANYPIISDMSLAKYAHLTATGLITRKLFLHINDNPHGLTQHNHDNAVSVECPELVDDIRFVRILEKLKPLNKFDHHEIPLSDHRKYFGYLVEILTSGIRDELKIAAIATAERDRYYPHGLTIPKNVVKFAQEMSYLTPLEKFDDLDTLLQPEIMRTLMQENAELHSTLIRYKSIADVIEADHPSILVSFKEWISTLFQTEDYFVLFSTLQFLVKAVEQVEDKDKRDYVTHYHLDCSCHGEKSVKMQFINYAFNLLYKLPTQVEKTEEEKRAHNKPEGGIEEYFN